MADETRFCACGCGTPVKGKWVRGHSSRGEAGSRPQRLPDPAELDDLPPLEFGTVDVDVPQSGDGTPSAGPPPGVEPPSGPADEPEDDEPPGHVREDWRKSRKRTRAKAAPVRVTAGIRKDIDAKIRFALQVPGSIWQARDPLCGGVFVQQIPDTAEAFTDIVLDSPDLIAFFTGPGGNFMKILKLGAALMPVVQVVAAHHVYHTVEIGEAPAEPDYQQYAA